MKALLIEDELVWRDSSSVALGAQLDISDSSNNMLIFENNNTEQDILNLISDVSENAYRLLDLEKAPEEDCEFLADSGICYRQIEGSA
jgi:hypothetical protein